MSDTVIKVEGLGKKYIIDHRQEGRSQYRALRDVLTDGAKAVGRRLNPLSTKVTDHPTKEEFWALKNVSFEINQGDRIGIIGRNGAGKSTLLKILSRITEPTTGRISITGRVASLLEVGTGFHPELTGRENIFLNGAVLGMSKIEIKKKFDEIVAFSEVEKFLDTPVKRYSSGMYVRLAFAVAAHLEPEILIIDEVLAVGDLSFQEKCLGKMRDVSQEGRTVVFVSHNVSAIRKLCSKGIVLVNGNVHKNGSIDLAISEYLEQITCLSSQDLWSRQDREGSGEFKFRSVVFTSEKGEILKSIKTGDKVSIVIEYESNIPVRLNEDKISIGFRNMLGQFLFNCPSTDGKIVDKKATLGNDRKVTSESKRFSQRLVCTIPKFPLAEGRYRFNLYAKLGHGEIADWIKDAGYIDVSPGDFHKNGKKGESKNQGVLVDFQWEL